MNPTFQSLAPGQHFLRVSGGDPPVRCMKFRYIVSSGMSEQPYNAIFMEGDWIGCFCHTPPDQEVEVVPPVDERIEQPGEVALKKLYDRDRCSPDYDEEAWNRIWRHADGLLHRNQQLRAKLIAAARDSQRLAEQLASHLSV